MTKQSTAASYADTGAIMVMMIAADMSLSVNTIGRACSPIAERIYVAERICALPLQ